MVRKGCDRRCYNSGSKLILIVVIFIVYVISRLCVKYGRDWMVWLRYWFIMYLLDPIDAVKFIYSRNYIKLFLVEPSASGIGKVESLYQCINSAAFD
jgi:hypothetical protein